MDVADRLALAISGACLIHCLAVPLIFALLPVLATVVHLPEALHLWLVVIAGPTSGYALLAGRRGERRYRPAALGIAGVMFLLIGATVAAGAFETLVTVVGGLLLATAHVLNWRSRHG